MTDTLNFRETLEYYDAPLLFIAERKDQTPFLCYLSERSATSDRYICAPVAPERLSEYLLGGVELRALFDSPLEGALYKTELSGIEPSSFHIEPAAAVPAEWLPTPGHFYAGSAESGKEDANDALTDRHAKLYAWELTRRYPSDAPQKLAASLADAQVDLNPHQVEAALFAFRSPLSYGAILADEVGLGKTIEAGILLAQMWAENKRRLLVIVPANLRKQWSQELLDKFYLPSAILESAAFNREIKAGKANPFARDDIAICSYHFARAKQEFIEAQGWDLAVIDEAHRLRNVYRPDNKIGKAIKQALHGVPKVLLTATPLQNNIMELYGLVSIIDEHAFGDLKSFKQQYAGPRKKAEYEDLRRRLKPLCHRTLRRQVREYVNFTGRICITEEFTPEADEERLYEEVSAYLQQTELYALPSSQRQLMTLILRKLLASSSRAIAGTLDALAEKLETLLEAQEAIARDVDARRAQAADERAPYKVPDDSTETGDPLVRTIRENFESYNDVREEWSEDAAADKRILLPEAEIRAMRAELSQLRASGVLAHSIDNDAKGRVLITALEKGLARAMQKGGNRKALIFTESRRTQEYVKEILEQSAFAGKTLLYNGANSNAQARAIYARWLKKHEGSDRVSGSRSADMRAALVEFFRDDAVIMIATEAAAEGINLQFCSLVVNYDLPWNPQRIEQRIGRCHRYGQKHDVVVVNFLNKNNAADQRVYKLLNEKFHLFEGVFGASDEVLGAIGSGIDFEKRIARIYQECRTSEEIQAQFDALQREMESDIEERMEQTKRTLLENFDKDVHNRLRVNLEESKRYLNRFERLLWNATRHFLGADAEFAPKEHAFMLRRNPFPSERIHPGPYRVGKDVTDANTYRPGHPLAQRILQACRALETPPALLIFDHSGMQATSARVAELTGAGGWLAAFNLRLDALETEDHILLCGYTDTGAALDTDLCRRLLFEPVPAREQRLGNFAVGLAAARERCRVLADKRRAEIAEEVEKRNAALFDDEFAKLERWADDLKKGLELELAALDKEIKLRRNAARAILPLADKVKAQREIKEMEKKRKERRRDLFSAQDDVDRRKDTLLNTTMARLRKDETLTELFIIRWSVI